MSWLAAPGAEVGPCGRGETRNSALDAVPEAYHNPAAVWWGLCIFRGQLTVRTLLAGKCLTQADGRPAHLTRVHQALVSLPGDDQRRLGVLAGWKHGPHLLTCRQTEYAFALAAAGLGKDEQDGLPPGPLQRVCDDLLEAGITEEFKNGSR